MLTFSFEILLELSDATELRANVSKWINCLRVFSSTFYLFHFGVQAFSFVILSQVYLFNLVTNASSWIRSCSFSWNIFSKLDGDVTACLINTTFPGLEWVLCKALWTDFWTKSAIVINKVITSEGTLHSSISIETLNRMLFPQHSLPLGTLLCLSIWCRINLQCTGY